MNSKQRKQDKRKWKYHVRLTYDQQIETDTTTCLIFAVTPGAMVDAVLVGANNTVTLVPAGNLPMRNKPCYLH